MSSKNNPENRGRVTKLREYNSKPVKPVMYVNPTENKRYIAGAYEDGSLVIADGSTLPIPYQSI
jgi:hypothetical protein